jgi:hypothetical protein
MPEWETVVLLVCAFVGLIAAVVFPTYLMNRIRRIK